MDSEDATCGQELARDAEVPETLARLVGHVAANMERHAATVDQASAAGRQEHSGLLAVARAYREMAEAGARAATAMRAMGEIRAARHDRADVDPESEARSVRAKIDLQRDVARLLSEHAATSEAELRQMHREPSAPRLASGLAERGADDDEARRALPPRDGVRGPARDEALPFERHNGRYVIMTDPRRLDLDAVHTYLARSYWAERIPKAIVEKAVAGSLSFALWDGDRQIGFARVVTDRATFAYLCDVYILEQHQGHGLGKWLIESVRAHPDLQRLRRFCLVTRDAHGLYDRCGFQAVGNPNGYMEIVQRNIY